VNTLLNALQPIGTLKSFKKRATILHQSEVPRYVYLVKEGVVRAYSLTQHGEEQVVQLHAAGDLFSMPWLYGKTNHALYYYEAQTNCRVLCVSKTDFLQVIADNPSFQTRILDYAVSEYTSAMMHITALEQPKAHEKVLTLLYYLATANGAEFKEGKFKVELNLTQSIIASLCGLTRETTALELSKLKKLGIIRYTARYYLIDKTRIESILGEDSFSQVKLDQL
jgi:CRP-like cAMP-binding protein